jgi:hypothetical protein
MYLIFYVKGPSHLVLPFLHTYVKYFGYIIVCIIEIIALNIDWIVVKNAQICGINISQPWIDLFFLHLSLGFVSHVDLNYTSFISLLIFSIGCA